MARPAAAVSSREPQGTAADSAAAGPSGAGAAADGDGGKPARLSGTDLEKLRLVAALDVYNGETRTVLPGKAALQSAYRQLGLVEPGKDLGNSGAHRLATAIKTVGAWPLPNARPTREDVDSIAGRLNAARAAAAEATVAGTGQELAGATA